MKQFVEFKAMDNDMFVQNVKHIDGLQTTKDERFQYHYWIMFDTGCDDIEISKLEYEKLRDVLLIQEFK